MRRGLLILLALSLSLSAAAVTAGVSTASTSNVSTYASGSFTPAANDLLYACVISSGNTAGSLTDSQSLGFTQITTALKNSSADTIYVFVANALAANSSMTVTFNTSGGNATGAIVMVARISGMTRKGSSAVKQSKVSSNQAASGTPATTFTGSALTGNPTLSCVGNGTNTGGVTVTSSWTRQSDTGYNTPSTGADYETRDSGFTGTTITWGGTSASAFGVVAVEMDTSALSYVSTPSVFVVH